MPSEIRRMVFFHSELADALRDFGKNYDVEFPDGKVIKASLASKAEYELHTQVSQPAMPLAKEYNVKQLSNSIIVTFFDEASFSHKYFNLASDFISSALIHFCIQRKIPIPKAGRKKLDVTEFNICMDIVLDSDETANIQLELEG